MYETYSEADPATLPLPSHMRPNSRPKCRWGQTVTCGAPFHDLRRHTAGAAFQLLPSAVGRLSWWADSILMARAVCRLLVHVIDGTSRDPIGDYQAIQQELELFSSDLAAKPQLVAYNKMDVPDSSDYWDSVQEFLLSQVCHGGWEGVAQGHVWSQNYTHAAVSQLCGVPTVRLPCLQRGDLTCNASGPSAVVPMPRSASRPVKETVDLRVGSYSVLSGRTTWTSMC